MTVRRVLNFAFSCGSWILWYHYTHLPLISVGAGLFLVARLAEYYTRELTEEE